MIRNKIISGEIQPGEWLRQEQLAQQLEVSHTPIRQALDWLVADGLAERVPHKGVRRSEINENEIAEIYCLRLLLDPIVARLAAINISDDQIERLQLIIEQSEKITSLNDMPSRRRLNREFHKIISESANFGTLERLSEIVWNRFPDWMFYEGLHIDADTITGRLSREIEEHRRIFDSIATHNANLAEKLSRAHITAFMKEDLTEVFSIPGKVLDEMEKQMGF
ncbi:MAG: GntR family transcriptional regulator [Anaerolineaceae bacterium]|nr:GntR family transcriptional regulator [Anaerolineaceae bacterium]